MVFLIKKPLDIFRQSMTLDVFMQCVQDAAQDRPQLQLNSLFRPYGLPQETVDTIRKSRKAKVQYFVFKDLTHDDVKNILGTPEEVAVSYTQTDNLPYQSIDAFIKAKPDPALSLIGIDPTKAKVVGIYNTHGREVKVDVSGQAYLVHYRNLGNHIGKFIAIDLHRERIEEHGGKVYLFDKPDDVYEYFHFKEHILCMQIADERMARSLSRNRRINGQLIDQWHNRKLEI